MSSLGTHGRLGNQLFQITSLLGLAEKYNATASFPHWEYEGYFENTIPHSAMSNNTVQERFFHHYDWELTGDSDLVGYLQSEKYFGSQRLKLKQDFVDGIKKIHPIFDRETICIQIRRGDYVGNPNYYQLKIEYYICALLENFPNWREANILVLSDDLEYSKVHFSCLPNVHFGTGTDITDLALASCCDHFIISNSSYGWWCAYLGEKPHSKIIHCSRLHAGKLSSKGNEDYYPERWTRFQRNEYKIPLKDVTFTVPVYYDHPSRKENLDLCLYMLQSSFHSNYIVCEQGGDKFEYTGQWSKYMKNTEGFFHRTKMLNDMCNVADTPYIANWDCDVFVPPMQLFMAVEALRAGIDMVYPYDGGFARMPRAQWYPQLQKFFDIGVVRNTPFKGRDPAENSVGGAVLWNKESFVDCGMENEYMLSFGPEDGERLDRAKKLGFSVGRIGGSLFHLNHHVGENSSPKNRYFNANVLEQQKIHNMTSAELRAYIDTWPWHHPYTARYYRDISEGSIRSAKIVMAELEHMGISTQYIIDIGCGVGEWSNGNPDYVGVDYRVDKSKLLFHTGNYFECNLNKAMPVLPSGKFDLALCLEVAEHLHPSRAEPLVAYLCSIADNVLFSAAIPYQGGSGHVNEQWQMYWGKLFAQYGFGVERDKGFMVFDFRDMEGVELWYRQNMVLYQRGADGKVENFVLPSYYEQIVGSLKR
jgi:hypothetical protein